MDGLSVATAARIEKERSWTRVNEGLAAGRPGSRCWRCCCWPARPGGADALLDFPSGPDQTLVRGADGGFGARMPAVAASASAPASGVAVRARVFEVVHKEGRSVDLAQAFEARFEPATTTHGHALVLSVRQPERVLPGSYAVSVLLDTEPAVKGLAPQTAVFKLSRPAAQLAAQPAAVVLVQDRACLPSPCVNPPARLQLETTSGQYPLGTTKGKIEFRADDLAAPLAVAFEVRARLARGWIVVLALAGALLGWAVRIVVSGEVGLRSAALAASEALQALATRRAASDDVEFRERLDAIEAALRAALVDKGESRTARATAITEAVKKALDDLKTRSDALDAALAEQLKRAHAWNPAIDVEWRLPKPSAAALRAVREAWAEVQARLQRRDAAGARQRLDRCETTTLPALHTQASADGADLVAALRTWVAQGPPLPVSTQQQLRGRADAAAAHFPTPPATAKTTTADGLRESLTRLDQLFHDADFEAGQLATTTRRFVDDALRELKTPASAFDDRRERLLAPALEQAQQAAATVARPRRASAALGAGVDRLRQAWAPVLGEDLPEDPAGTAKVTALLAGANWAEAVTTAVALRAKKVGVAAMASRAMTDVPASLRGQACAPAAPSERVPSARGEWPTTLGTLPPLTGAPAERLELAQQLHLLELWQSLAFCALFVAAVWVLHADAWVGTWKEVLTIVLLAFGFDWTGESLLTWTKKVKPD